MTDPRQPKPGRSLADLRPDLVAQWHPSLNEDLTPDQVMERSGKMVWWKCDVGHDHEWQTKIADRSSGGNGCPFCAGRFASVTNSLARFPELVAQWHPTLNGDLRPDQVAAGTHKKAWWKCDVGPDHQWQAVVNSRSSGGESGCPFCAGRFASVTNSLARFTELVAQWHPTLNGDLTPDQMAAGSTKSVWWKCPEGPDHEWQTSARSRSSKELGCPCCSGYRVSVTNSLARFPELVAQWHPTLNGDLTPDQVVAGTQKKVWWKCDVGPDHEWQTTAVNRSRVGRGCPFCVGQRVSVTNSLARFPDLVAQWHPTRNGDLRPDQMVAGSGKKVWWKCPKGPDHEWQAPGNNRSSTPESGCPFCAERGYNPGKPGTLYVLCGDQWGKVGISNVMAQRLAKHARGGAFGSLVVAAQFTDGTLPVRLEVNLLEFIAKWTVERVSEGVDGYTESFPAWFRDDVVNELFRLLEELPKYGWELPFPSAPAPE